MFGIVTKRARRGRARQRSGVFISDIKIMANGLQMAYMLWGNALTVIEISTRKIARNFHFRVIKATIPDVKGISAGSHLLL